MPPSASKISPLTASTALRTPLPPIARLVAVAQLDRLVRAGRGAGRHRGAAARAVLQHDVDFDGRIAAAVEDFAADNVDNGGHGGVRQSYWRASTGSRDPPCHARRDGRPYRSADGKKAAATRPPGRASPPRPTRRVLDRVPNPHPDTELRRALHRAGIHRAVPDHRPAGFRASRHRLCAGAVSGRVEVAEALSRTASATTAPSTRTARSPSASGWSRCSSRNGCASAAIGIRAAACRSTCSGRPASLPKGVWVPDQGVAPYRGRG